MGAAAGTSAALAAPVASNDTTATAPSNFFIVDPRKFKERVNKARQKARSREAAAAAQARTRTQCEAYYVPPILSLPRPTALSTAQAESSKESYQRRRVDTG